MPCPEGHDIVAEEFYTETLDNGLALLAQPMPNVASAATVLLLPAGAAWDSPGEAGSGHVALEWSLRGAGGRSTRELNDALDALGCHHNETVRSAHTALSAVQLGRNLDAVLPLLADIVRRPNLDDETFEPARALVLQDLAALEDEPARKCNLLLREQFYPWPLGRNPYGSAETLRASTPDSVRQRVQRHWRPDGAILAAAGKVTWDDFRGRAAELFGDWSAPDRPALASEPARGGRRHLPKDSAQTHIGLAQASVPLSDERYYPARVAEMVLSGGMSSRLFTEVREKRGLAYHVSCRYHSLKEHAGLFTYAGTRPELAQQTHDVTVAELRRVAEGIEPEELTRAAVQLKSALVMQGESTSRRAAALAGDWHHLKRLRSLEEISAAVDAVTADDVLDYLRACPAENLTTLVIGPDPLDAGDNRT